MNINQPTQFNPGETAYTNTVLDNIKGEPNVNGGRNILQELLFSPWMAEGWKDFKKPWLVDLMRSALGEHFVEAVGNWTVPPTRIEQGQYDTSKDTDLQQRYLKSRRYYAPKDSNK